MFRKKRKVSQNQNMLAEGVCLRQDVWRQEENRLFTLLIKGVLVYLIVMGGIGCYLTALEIRCAWIVVHLFILLGALFCSVLYYSKLWENLGYFLLLFMMLGTGILFRNYISSGFFVTLNELGQKASIFFDTAAVRSFAEQVENRYMAVTISMSYIGWVGCVLLNVVISRRMQYIVAVPIVLGALFFPLYITSEPSLFYVIMLLAGWMACYAIRGNRHYQLSGENTCYQFLKKKKEISYIYASRTVVGAVLMVMVLCAVISGLFAAVHPYQKNSITQAPSSLKSASMETVGNFMLLGFAGLMNFYPNTGGLMSGQLGGVSSIRFDYETDLTVEYAPWSEERIYLKTFTGADYMAYQNRWQRAVDVNGVQLPETVDVSAVQRRKNFEAGKEDAARGRMNITNTAAATGVYLPYYSEDIEKEIVPGDTQTYVYYPPVSESVSVKEKEDVSNYEWKLDSDHSMQIYKFCKDAGLSADQPVEEIVTKLTAYFRENYTYSTRPGATPYSSDFINYFLEENKKGYCAHFASAATLIFRFLDVPARYVEGYAIDPTDLLDDGTILEDQNYSDYYEGYNPLGETAVVSVDVSDASAHAWVEIYIENKGWQVVEVTPPSSETSDSGLSMIQRLARLLGNAQGDNNAIQNAADGGGTGLTEGAGRMAGITMAVFFAVVLLAFLVFRLVIYWIKRHQYRCAAVNDQIIMDYQAFIRSFKKNPDFSSLVNYRDQAEWFVRHGYWQISADERQRLTDILERAGFSDREISRDEKEWIGKWIKRRPGRKK